MLHGQASQPRSRQMHLLLACGMSMLASLSLAETVIASLVHCSHPSDWKNQWSKRPQRARPGGCVGGASGAGCMTDDAGLWRRQGDACRSNGAVPL